MEKLDSGLETSLKIKTQEIDTKANVFPHPPWDWTLTSGYGM